MPGSPTCDSESLLEEEVGHWSTQLAAPGGPPLARRIAAEHPAASHPSHVQLDSHPSPVQPDRTEERCQRLFAEPATEVSGTRPWYTFVWLERFSSLGARGWGIAPDLELQGDRRLPLHALSSSKSDESEASASCSALSRPVAHRPPSEGPPNRTWCKK